MRVPKGQAFLMQRAVLILIRRSVRSILLLELLVKRLAFATRFNASVMKRFPLVSILLSEKMRVRTPVADISQLSENDAKLVPCSNQGF